MNYPLFEARPGTVISVLSPHLQAHSICGYCRALVLEDDHLRFIDGFRRYADRNRGISWAEYAEWPLTPIRQVTIHIVSEKPWMQIIQRSDSQPNPNI